MYYRQSQVEIFSSEQTKTNKTFCENICNLCVVTRREKYPWIYNTKTKLGIYYAIYKLMV